MPIFGTTEKSPTAHWVDLAEYQFSEGEATWIQAFPIGTYHHPLYGKIDVTPDKVQRMAANVNNKVRGQDLDIDYDHKQRTNEAAGWVKAAEARDDGLWLAVEWTRTALSKIKEKAYRYFSPEYSDEWTDNQKRKWQDVIFGGALTNRPFLKNILPINLSETNTDGGPSSMNKEMLELLGLPEDASEDAIKEALTKLKDDGDGKPDSQTESETTTETKEEDKTKEPATAGAGLSDDEEVKKLAESSPLVKGLVERLAILETASRLSEVDAKLTTIAGDGKLIAPAQLNEFRDTILELPREQGNKVLDALANINVVELAERGRVNGIEGGAESGGAATKKFTEAVDARVKAGESYADATTNVASENPALFDEYRNESYIRERGAK